MKDAINPSSITLSISAVNCSIRLKLIWFFVSRYTILGRHLVHIIGGWGETEELRFETLVA